MCVCVGGTSLPLHRPICICSSCAVPTLGGSFPLRLTHQPSHLQTRNHFPSSPLQQPLQPANALISRLPGIHVNSSPFPPSTFTSIVPIREGSELIDYNEMTPRAVYAALICWIGAGFSLTWAVWPVWGWFSPVLITILGIALTLSTRLVPSCGWCSRRLCPNGSRGRGRYIRLRQQPSQNDPHDGEDDVADDAKARGQ